MVTLLDTVSNRPRHPEKEHRPDQPVMRKPDWIRVRAPSSPVFAETQRTVRENGLVTVCEEAGCPNIGECWEKKHATMMIMGDTCTRACAFCNVRTGLPGPLDPQEPENVARAVSKLGLNHVVITSVDRDDLEDGGAQHFVETIQAIRESLSRENFPKSTLQMFSRLFGSFSYNLHLYSIFPGKGLHSPITLSAEIVLVHCNCSLSLLLFTFLLRARRSKVTTFL